MVITSTIEVIYSIFHYLDHINLNGIMDKKRAENSESLK